MSALCATLISPGPEILNFGPFSLRWYGILIAFSVLIGFNLSTSLAKKRGLDSGLINDLLPVLILTSVIGARIYYVTFAWRQYQYNLIEALAIWKGGIAIHGALIAGTIAVFIFCRIRKKPFLNILDILLPSVALGQAIGRWGNFFNNEAFGIPTNLPWKLFIPYYFRPKEFIDFQYFHPTFLYESVWNFTIFLILIYLFKLGVNKKIVLPIGSLSFIYLITYSLGRFWIEGLRTDPLCIGALPPFCEGGIKIAQFMSILLMLIGSTGLWLLYKRNKESSHLSNHSRS